MLIKSFQLWYNGAIQVDWGSHTVSQFPFFFDLVLINVNYTKSFVDTLFCFPIESFSHISYVPIYFGLVIDKRPNQTTSYEKKTGTSVLLAIKDGRVSEMHDNSLPLQNLILKLQSRMWYDNTLLVSLQLQHENTSLFSPMYAFLLVTPISMEVFHHCGQKQCTWMFI